MTVKNHVSVGTRPYWCRTTMLALSTVLMSLLFAWSGSRYTALLYGFTSALASFWLLKEYLLWRKYPALLTLDNDLLITPYSGTEGLIEIEKISSIRLVPSSHNRYAATIEINYQGFFGFRRCYVKSEPELSSVTEFLQTHFKDKLTIHQTLAPESR